MDVREKLVELSDIQVLQREIECVKRKSTTNCTDCLNCDLLMTDERILTAYTNAIDALENAQGVTLQEWISVDARLPDWRDGKVLVFTKYGFSICERTVNNRWQGQHANWITHWCRLPKPPKGE